MSKPTLDEVMNYAKKRIGIALYKSAASLPAEQQEEAEQEAWVRVLEAYQKIDGESWKSFISTHCSGGVLDYIKAGHGFLEDRRGKDTRKNMKDRVSIVDEKGNSLDVDEVAGINGIFHEEDFMKNYDIKWPLVAKMASVDTNIHILAKIILGFDFIELAKIFKCSNEDISRRYRRFLKRLSMPAYARDPWLDQFIYAFGLSETFNTASKSNGLGEKLTPVDLYSNKPIKKSKQDEPVHHWVQDLYPDNQDSLESVVKWDLLAKMADKDEDVHLVLKILRGSTKNELERFFDADAQSLKSRCLHFIKRLDSPKEYHSDWIKQVIYALGLSSHYFQENKDWGIGHFLRPVDLQQKKKKPKKSYQLSMLTALI